MTNRRGFLAGLVSASLLPAPSWADVGSPGFVTAAKTSSGDFVLVGLSDHLGELFRLPLPSRGHAAAAHPTRPEAVGFARRPGTYALVIDCRNGAISAQMQAPEGRHFYGHGAFSADGSVLFTTENDFEAGRGVIGVWDAKRSYRRIGEFDSGGVGPHELSLMPDGQALIVANGGIDTHPDSGRAKLNIPTMRPNLSLIGLDGTILDMAEPPVALRRNSIRHLDVRADGRVAFGMQWQRDIHTTPPLVGTYTVGQGPVIAPENAIWRNMHAYVGSVSFVRGGTRIAVTSPRGGVVVELDADSLEPLASHLQSDVCGVSTRDGHVVTTTGQGELFLDERRMGQIRELAFDNHLVAISG
ncbi:DUF1513 domain-containing protein [uncultured Pelagimonas sp.]|uniref:DUF1513 domain-containing protein n=1 Tax=uncultured Pelagimonas sp. TaxID=1618102 RepID=UPI002616FF37|nr:DUF1513 domain-containing protein [uncultured Pelagimonas sp.]